MLPPTAELYCDCDVMLLVQEVGHARATCFMLEPWGLLNVGEARKLHQFIMRIYRGMLGLDQPGG